MNDLQKLIQTKQYLDKLADGINPFTDEELPDTDIVNHVKISRSLFYLSALLDRVIANGGKPERKRRSTAFTITQEALSRFEYSEMPIALSEIVRRINALADIDSMGKLSFRTVSNWLIQIGALQEIIGADGRRAKRPSPIGQELGIALETRSGYRGNYQVVVYNKAAQQFILDNLLSVLQLNNVT